ncbi:MAG: ribbon-helix-helix domain-containing protein [Elusimicrobia bacterium]|nr:ribbon-helix-helix domain-containing protein [Candidatus Liberimonas magnetica]
MEITIPEKQKRAENKPGKDFVTLYFALPKNLSDRLEGHAKDQKTTESAVLRNMIDEYFSKNKGKSLDYSPLKKLSILGMKTTPRTVRRDQDKMLRDFSQKTGRNVSEIVRNAIEKY